MNPSDLFWSVYANLEQEVLTIARYIHCDSDQLTVYSMAIADLIVRCAMEIEAISKQLYQQLGGNMNPLTSKGKPKRLLFDNDCLALIDANYHLAKKQVIISAPVFFLDDAERQIMPLQEADKKGQGHGCEWKDAYQALKHDRYAKLKDYGNIKNLLHAMGALYILNLYLRDKVFQLPEGFLSFDSRVDSVLFSVLTYSAEDIHFQSTKDGGHFIYPRKGISLENSIYIIKFRDRHYKALYDAFVADDEYSRKRIAESPEIQEFLARHPDYHAYNIKLVEDAIGSDVITEFFNSENLLKQYSIPRREAVLNKGQQIYPPLP